MDVKVPGKLTSFEEAAGSEVKTVTVGDKTYDVAVGTFVPALDRTLWISTDAGETFELATQDDVEDVLDEEVTLYLNPVGKVAAIVAGGTGDAGKIYGVVNDLGQTLYNGAIQESFEVLKADGTLVNYTYDEDSELNNGGERSFAADDIGSGDPVDIGVFVEITLNSDGSVKKINTGDANPGTITGVTHVAIISSAHTLDGDEDNDTVAIDGTAYDAGNVVVFDVAALFPTPPATVEDAEVVSAEDFIDYAADGRTGIADFTGSLTYKAKNGVLQYVVIQSVSGIGGQGNLAMVAGVGTDKDGKYARFLQQDGTTKKVYLGDNPSVASKGKLIYYDLSNDEADITAWGDGDTTNWQCTGDTLTVKKVSGNIISFEEGNAQYAVDTDTLYFDCTDDDPAAAEKSDIAAGDRVEVYKDRDKAIGAIVLVE